MPGSLFLVPDPPLPRADVAEPSHQACGRQSPQETKRPQDPPDDTSPIHSALPPRPSPPRLPVPCIVTLVHVGFSTQWVLQFF